MPGDMYVDVVDLVIDDWARERSDLDPEVLGITSRLQMLRKVFSREDTRVLEPLGLAPWTCDVLLALRRQGEPYRLTPTDLRKLGMLTSGGMTARLDRMEQAGLVRRVPDPDDRRSLRVELTEQGRQMADRALAARLEASRRLVAPLTAAERGSAARILRKLLVGAAPESRVPRPGAELEPGGLNRNHLRRPAKP